MTQNEQQQQQSRQHCTQHDTPNTVQERPQARRVAPRTTTRRTGMGDRSYIQYERGARKRQDARYTRSNSTRPPERYSRQARARQDSYPVGSRTSSDVRTTQPDHLAAPPTPTQQMPQETPESAGKGLLKGLSVPQVLGTALAA
ncbi:MAG: hypothetical protein ACI364_04165, partial [Coriobacteriales bacterium]